MPDDKPTEPISITGEDAEKAPKRPRNLYGYVRQAWKIPSKSYVKELAWRRQIEWRRGPSFVRVEHPLRIDRARELGFRAKPGFIIVRARVRRGGRRKPWPMGGRHPKRRGMNKITMGKSIQRMAEERVSKRHPNMEVLNSYWVGEDGGHKYYEVILVDPQHPAIRNDPKINWICEPQHRGRAFRGLTSAGRKGRGLMYKGKGAERSRPSIGAHDRKGK
ncbi:MAG: 50S ribosomal protein L15e [Methanobacteriota archaeon]|nr:MAG: 50S ribosomal protein L15e [Euryarchaeota archaeon]